MSEQPTPTEPVEQAEQPQEGAEAKTFDESYVKKLREEAAKHRTEAKANADAAKRLAEIEDEKKSDAEKVADRIAKADAEVASVPHKVADALRGHLIDLHQIDADDAELFLTANDPELLLKQVQRLVDRAEDARKPRTPRPDPVQGRTPGAIPLDPRAADLAQIEHDLATSKRG